MEVTLFTSLSLAAVWAYQKRGMDGLTAVSLLLGFAFDTTLHGLYLTYDFAWQSGWTTAVLMIALTAVFLWLLFTSEMKEAVDGMSEKLLEQGSDKFLEGMGNTSKSVNV